jgi:Uncharacterised nucleotidyltransferase
VPADVDWDQFLRRAQRLRVAALVRPTLTRLVDASRVPPEVLRRLDQVYYERALRNARLGASLAEVLAAFSRQGAPVIVLKGASLAEHVYGDIAVRPMRDLDVLVRPRDLDLADRLVRELGYVPDESYRTADWYRRHHHHLVPYRSGDGSSILEVHHHIFPPAPDLRVPIEDLWQRARQADLGFGAALVLAPADLLLHLSVGLSAVEHFLGGLKTLCDIAAAIKRYDTALSWPCLLESARRYGLAKPLYYGLWLARDLVGADVPPPVLDQLRRAIRGRWAEDRVVKWMSRTAVFRYEGDRSVVPPGLLSGVLAELLASKRGSAKLGGLLRLAYRGFRRLPARALL